MKVELLSGTGTLHRREELTSLVLDAVEHGAAIGFARRPAEADVERYWHGVAGEVASGHKELLVALDERGRVVGSAQLALDPQESEPRSARVQKVLVKHAVRGRGIGAMLMARLEQQALAVGRTELFIDSSKGASGASVFCRRLGYRFVGSQSQPSSGPGGPMADGAVFHKVLSAADGSAAIHAVAV